MSCVFQEEVLVNRVFEASDYFEVPDGTDVSPFLNATDVNQTELPWGALGDLSIASGRVRAGVHSWVHFHPAVAQVTYCVSGRLTVRLKAPDEPDYHDRDLGPGQAVVSTPRSLFQLRNDTSADAYVLYIVSPSYVFLMHGDDVVYDDARLVTKTWEELAAEDYQNETLTVDEADLGVRREAALAELERQKVEAGGKGAAVSAS